MPPAPESTSPGQASPPAAAGRSLQAGPAPALEPRGGTSASCGFRAPRRTPRRTRDRLTAAPRAGPPRPRALSADPPPAVLAGAHAPSSSDRAPCVGCFLLRSNGARRVAPSPLIAGPQLAGTDVRLEKHRSNTRQCERAKWAHNKKLASHLGARCGVHTQDVSTRKRHNLQGSSRPRTQRGKGRAQPEGCVTPRLSARQRQRTTREVRHAQALSAANAAHYPKGASRERSQRGEGSAQPEGCVTPRRSALRTQRTTQRVRHAKALSAATAAHNPRNTSRPGTSRGERSAQPKGCVTRWHSARRRQRTTRGVRHAQALRAANAAHNPKGASRVGTPRGEGGAQPKGCVTSRLSARRRQRTTRRVRHAEALVSVPHDLQGASLNEGL